MLATPECIAGVYEWPAGSATARELSHIEDLSAFQVSGVSVQLPVEGPLDQQLAHIEPSGIATSKADYEEHGLAVTTGVVEPDGLAFGEFS